MTPRKSDPDVQRPKNLWSDQIDDKGVPDEERMGDVLTVHALQHRSRASGRKARAAAQLSAYEGLTLTSLDPDQYDLAMSDDPDLIEVRNAEGGTEYRQTHNLGARVMDAIDAKIFALDKVKTRFVVTDGGWQVKTAAVKAGRFIDGQMSESSGIFKDMWELWRHAARLATIATGTSAVFFWSDSRQGKIITELDDTLDMFLDTTGLAYDGYTSIGRTTFWDPEKLAVRYPDHKGKIYQAADQWETIKSQYLITELDDDNDQASPNVRVPLIQGWKMQYAGGKDNGGYDGIHCATVPGQTLEVGAYDHPDPPCVIFNPMRQLAGKWGRTILERSLPAIQAYNRVLNSSDNSERLTPRREKYYDPSVTDPDNFKIVNDVLYIPHTGSLQQIPVEVNPKPFDIAATQFMLELHKEAAYNLPGLNEAHATMDLGKTMSGVALRLVKNEIYEIFSPLEDEITRCSGPETAKQIIRCAREIQKAKGGFSATWKGGQDGGWLQEIGADVFDILEKHKYRAEPESISGTTDTPADRIALAQELMETGIITGEAYASILQTYDTPGESGDELRQAQTRVCERMIDDWMYAEIDKAKARTIDPEMWMDRDFSMTVKVAAAYLNARADMIEDLGEDEVRQRLQMFKDYLAKLKANADKRAAEDAQRQAAAQPPPPSPGGAPPMQMPPGPPPAPAMTPPAAA